MSRFLCAIGLHKWKHTATAWVRILWFVARYECTRPGCDALHLCDRYWSDTLLPVPHGPFRPDPTIPVRDLEEEHRRSQTHWTQRAST